MASIERKQLVRAPLGSADRLLKEYLAGHPGPEGNARLTLRAHDLEKPALITLTPAHRPQDMTPRFGVHWEAEGGGPYPAFNGTLTIGADEDYNSFVLLLEGGYEPPLGIVGQVFDAVVGHRIAEETAAGLLAEMRAAIETKLAEEEASKAAGRAAHSDA